MQMLVCLENDCRTYREVIAAGIQIYSDAKVWVNGQQVAFIHEVRRRDVLRGSRYCNCSNEFPVAEYFMNVPFRGSLRTAGRAGTMSDCTPALKRLSTYR
jgi:hypothetical protein